MTRCANYHDGYPLDGCGACEPCRVNDAATEAVLAAMTNGDLPEHDNDLYFDTVAELAAERYHALEE